MNNKFFKLSLIFALAVAFTSCDVFSDPEEPDYREELKVLLPSVQHISGYFNGTDHSRFQLQWSQQLAGVRGVHLAVDKYEMLPVHTQEMWELYFGTHFPSLSLIVQYANEIEAPAYRGIAKVLYLMNLALMTDAFGDIPNQYAISYSQGIGAQYDGQEDIYSYMLEQIDVAIADIDMAISGESPKPEPSEDLFYGGDLHKWHKAAHVLKLRFLMRIAHRNNDYELVRLNIFAPSLFAGNQDDLEYTFSGNQQNQFYVYDNMVRNTRIGNFFVEKLKETNDPRLPVFVKKTTSNNEYVGSAPGEAKLDASFIGSQLAGQQSPATLISYVEQKFIEAEVQYRTGNQALADLAFEEAVKASLQKYGVSNPEWEAEHASIQNVTLEQIINAKYLALFLNPEVWTDYRRTGFPALTPYAAAETPAIPRRFLYPANEQAYNTGNVPPNVTIYTNMWWDVAR